MKYPEDSRNLEYMDYDRPYIDRYRSINIQKEYSSFGYHFYVKRWGLYYFSEGSRY